jgi:hypothetical protein
MGRNNYLGVVARIMNAVSCRATVPTATVLALGLFFMPPIPNTIDAIMVRPHTKP